MPAKTFPIDRWAKPIPLISFFASFFLCCMFIFLVRIILGYCLMVVAFAVVLHHRREAEAGSAEVQPARNISD